MKLRWKKARANSFNALVLHSRLTNFSCSLSDQLLVEQLVKQAHEEVEEEATADSGAGDEVASRAGSASGSGGATVEEGASEGQYSGNGGSEQLYLSSVSVCVCRGRRIYHNW